jgi:AraC-like DNA-binding protein
VPGLGLLLADFTDHEYRPHLHSEMVVAVTETGGAVITSRGVEAEARPERLFVLNPGEVQSARMGRSRRWVYRSFYFGEEALEDICRGLGLAKRPSFPSSAIDDKGLVAGFRLLHSALEQRRDVCEIREQLIQVFAHMFERCNTAVRSKDTGPADRARFSKLAAVVRTHRLDELRLEELAAVTDLTVFQLIRLFKRVAGLTPHAYLVQLRLDDARRHLRNGMPIAEAAMAAGFYDQSALTKHFRRSYGITPRQYVMAVRR